MTLGEPIPPLGIQYPVYNEQVGPRFPFGSQAFIKLWSLFCLCSQHLTLKIHLITPCQHRGLGHLTTPRGLA